MSELRECPFPTAGIVHEPKVITAVGESWVLCTCGASGPMFSDADGNGESRAIEAWNTRAERTCHYFPDSVQVAFDENDEEIETGEAYSDGCDYSCSICGFTMLGGEEGWFDETPGEYGGWNYKARFSYCPNCGARVVAE